VSRFWCWLLGHKLVITAAPEFSDKGSLAMLQPQHEDAGRENSEPESLLAS
jgi:hypothetical protein